MQIAVLSGKGGTGKTTIAVGISEVIKNSTKIDCDVDAANMHLFYTGEKITKEEFHSGKKAYIEIDKCIKCNKCIENCKFDAISEYNNEYIIDTIKCEGCGVCNLVCPVEAVRLKENKVADIMQVRLTDGKLVRADMEIGADGSGKLITELRKKADNNNITIIDGSPGIGCSVIASIVGVNLCLIVIEPTVSGLSDLERILKLVDSFKLKTLVCINKYDINQDMTDNIKRYCEENNVEVIGLIPYDDAVIKSINELKPITRFHDSLAGKQVRNIAEKIIKIGGFENECSDSV